MSDSKDTWTSKLNHVFPRSDILALEDSHKKTLRKLRLLPENMICADCGRREGAGPLAWAVVNRGTFVCVRCASLHRGVGTHISKVKGLSGTYLWGPDEVESMAAGGNKRVADIYGPHDGGRIMAELSNAADASVRQFILDRYDRQVWRTKETERIHASGLSASVGPQGCRSEWRVPDDFDPFETYESASEGGELSAVEPKLTRGEAKKTLPAVTHAAKKPAATAQEIDDFFAELGI